MFDDELQEFDSWGAGGLAGGPGRMMTVLCYMRKEECPACAGGEAGARARADDAVLERAAPARQNRSKIRAGSLSRPFPGKVYNKTSNTLPDIIPHDCPGQLAHYAPSQDFSKRP